MVAGAFLFAVRRRPDVPEKSDTHEKTAQVSQTTDVVMDLLVFGGLLALSTGVWMAFGLPYALMTVGSLALALGVFGIIWSTRS
jgi:hypothetical protein